MECWRTLSEPPTATTFKPSDLIALRLASLRLLMTYVPAGYFSPRTVNDSSATFTEVGAIFHGSTADLQSPRWRTRNGPEPSGMVPSTFASVVRSCIGFDRIV